MNSECRPLLMGIDIGTTTLSFILIDMRSGTDIRTITRDNDSALPAAPGQSIQDAERIVCAVLETAQSLCREYPGVCAIGLTGQMHGVVCLDAQGRAVSPLYTWQDQHADGACCAEIQQITGMQIFTGYGHATLFALAREGLMPAAAAQYCTIMDYAGMRLTGNASPVIHASNAASFGLYDVTACAFADRAVRALGLSGLSTPDTTCESRIIGRFMGIPVAVSIGDNQASFFGSVREESCSALVNYGTGSQLSMAADRPAAHPGAEIRPYIGGRYLLCASALCGGRAYAMMERFFSAYMQAAGCGDAPQYETMNVLAERALLSRGAPKVSTLFCGTRNNPSLRGSITDIGEDNFTPGHFILGLIEGMAAELYDSFDPARLASLEHLIASGNAVQKNAVLRRMLCEKFRLPLSLSCRKEEAAFGAALFGGLCAGLLDMQQAKSLIVYNDPV